LPVFTAYVGTAGKSTAIGLLTACERALVAKTSAGTAVFTLGTAVTFGLSIAHTGTIASKTAHASIVFVGVVFGLSGCSLLLFLDLETLAVELAVVEGSTVTAFFVALTAPKRTWTTFGNEVAAGGTKRAGRSVTDIRFFGCTAVSLQITVLSSFEQTLAALVTGHCGSGQKQNQEN